jgi:hypothetical protein
MTGSGQRFWSNRHENNTIIDPESSETYSGRSAEIEHDLALLEEAIFLVELDQLEGGTRAVSLLLGKLVPLVETALAVLLLDRHGAGCVVASDPGPVVLAGSCGRRASGCSWTGFGRRCAALNPPKFLAETTGDKR